MTVLKRCLWLRSEDHFLSPVFRKRENKCPLVGADSVIRLSGVFRFAGGIGFSNGQSGATPICVLRSLRVGYTAGRKHERISRYSSRYHNGSASLGGRR